MPSAVATVPTLSQVRNWDIEHLTQAADHWTRTATVWEEKFTELADRISQPGGTPWEGHAAEAAQQLAYSDRMIVIGLADQLHTASDIARAGAREIGEAQRAVLRVVTAAENAGFTVTEYFSVTDPRLYDEATAAVRQAQAEALATQLRATLSTLVGADTQVAGRLTASTTGLGVDPFTRSGGNAPQEHEKKDGVHKLVGDMPLSPGDQEPVPPTPGDGSEFTIGPPTKPDISWDEDFVYGSATPTPEDYLSRAKWQAKLAGGRVIRSDLDDATEMYRHYWDNDGTPMEFDLEEACREDPAIQANVDDQIRRAQLGAEQLIRASNKSFSMTGAASAVDNYPAEENWQKTIGGYQQWSSADVRVEGNTVTMTVTVHAEDHYNFNRGQADIATEAPDNVNGRFTELGWAKPFDSHGEVTRTVTWQLGSAPGSPPAGTPQFNPGGEDRIDARGSAG